MVADDEIDILETTETLLQMAGYQVTPVSDASQIVGTLQSARPALLLQDCNMPGLDVDKLVAKIHADPTLAKLPIYLFTGSVDALATVQRLRVEGYVEKPFDAETLRKRVAAALARGVAH